MIGIFPNGAGERPAVNAVDDLGPGLAVVGSFVEVGSKIVQLVFGDSDIGRARVKRRSLDGVDLAPFRNIFGRDVLPMLAAILGQLHQAVIGANPDEALLQGRFDHGEDRVVIFNAGVVFGDGPARRTLLRFVVAGEIAANRFPTLSAVRCFEKHAAAGIERGWIVGRKNQRKGPLKAVFHRFGARTHGVVRPNGHVAQLTGGLVLPRDQAVIGACVNDLGVFGIRRNPAALAAAYVIPVALGDRSIVRSCGRAHGAVVLLRAVGVIGEVVIQRHAVKLRGRLIAFRRPRLAAIGAYIRATVVALDHAIGIDG